MTYTGRFAPSPSGRLHFGSLVCALGSYLRARSCGGRILLRIEDLDFPRCSSEYTKIIIDELKDLGFIYDDKPYIQSEHLDFYRQKADKLLIKDLAYKCFCTRRELKIKTCQCREKEVDINSQKPFSIRFSSDLKTNESFYDELLGSVFITSPQSEVTLIRSDGIISYNLGCVLDDIHQGVTEIVRGSDLIDVTPLQKSLYRAFGADQAKYLHLPLVMQNSLYKLSKQNKAQPVMTQGTPSELLLCALAFLGQSTDDLNEKQSPETILEKAICRFDLNLIPKEPKLSPL